MKRFEEPRVPLVQATAESLPFADESFDIAFSSFGAVPFVAEPARVMAESARVLRPGGHLGLVWNVRDERIPWVKRLGHLTMLLVSVTITAACTSLMRCGWLTSIERGRSMIVASNAARISPCS